MYMGRMFRVFIKYCPLTLNVVIFLNSTIRSASDRSTL